MTIAAKYENGVFKALEEVQLAEGTRVSIQVPDEAPPKQWKSFREFAAFGMWADREDISDGITFVNRLREPRY